MIRTIVGTTHDNSYSGNMSYETRSSRQLSTREPEDRADFQRRQSRRGVVPWREAREPYHRCRYRLGWRNTLGRGSWVPCPRDRIKGTQRRKPRELLMEDMEQIAALLHIHEKAHHHGSALTNIRDEAFRQLKALDDKIVKDRAERQAPQVTVVN